MIEKQKHRRNSFAADYGGKDDEFILADLDVMRDEEEPFPVPLNHFMEDEDAIDRLLANTGFDDIQDKENATATDQILFDPENSKFGFEQEEDSELMTQEDDADSFNEKQAKPVLVFDSLDTPEKNASTVSGAEQAPVLQLIKAYEHQAKKEALMTYASLGIALVALLSAVIMGAVVFGMHSKVVKLSDLVSILEEDMGSIAGKNPDLDINHGDASIEQLNQKLNGLPESLEEQTPPSTDILGNERAVDAKKEASVEKLSTKKSHQQNPPIKQSLSSADSLKNKTATFAEKPETVNKAHDKQQTKTPAPDNKKPAKAGVKKGSSEKAASKAQATAGWSVNLTAYENQSYAKKKAAKLLQKGIPVKVIAVDMNNAKWYRLKVDGFKKKEEATAYAAKIKKSLRLDSVSVVDK